jgi:hypothetical protein
MTIPFARMRRAVSGLVVQGAGWTCFFTGLLVVFAGDIGFLKPFAGFSLHDCGMQPDK